MASSPRTFVPGSSIPDSVIKRLLASIQQVSAMPTETEIVESLVDRRLAKAVRMALDTRFTRPGMETDLVGRDALDGLAVALKEWEDENGKD